MTIERCIGDLHARVLTLEDALLALRVTVAEDGPRGGESALVDALSDSVDDTLGSVREVAAAASDAVHSAMPPVEVERVRHQLGECHRIATRLLRCLTVNVIGPGRIDDLTRIAQRGRGYRMWSAAVKAAGVRCVEELCEVLEALGGCWADVAERTSLLSVHPGVGGDRETDETQGHRGRHPISTATGFPPPRGGIVSTRTRAGVDAAQNQQHRDQE
jgi:hypothetical protein